MVSQSNLALALEPENALKSPAANAAVYGNPLQSATVKPRASRQNKRRRPVYFKSDFAAELRPFRVY